MREVSAHAQNDNRSAAAEIFAIGSYFPNTPRKSRSFHGLLLQPTWILYTKTVTKAEIWIRSTEFVALYQGWANYGPLRGSMRPAEGLENAKQKNEVSKNICANIIKPSKMKAE
jgi:hypothetical protein